MRHPDEILERTPIEQIRVVTAGTFLRLSHALVTEPGVYGLLFRNGQALLEATGYEGRRPFAIGAFVHVYTGASFELGKRIPHHLVGNARRSNMRETLFALDAYFDGIVGRLFLESRALNESALTNWMMGNVLIAYQRCSDPAHVETEFLQATASPLNVDKRRPSAYARRLMALRCALQGKPVPAWCWSAAKHQLDPHALEGEA